MSMGLGENCSISKKRIKDFINGWNNKKYLNKLYKTVEEPMNKLVKVDKTNKKKKQLKDKTAQLSTPHFDAFNLKLLVPEFEDWKQVLIYGAKKHGELNWLDKNGNTSSEKDMHASMFRHLAASSTGQKIDKDSKLDHLLHLVCRALMVYTRRKRKLTHDNDKS